MSSTYPLSNPDADSRLTSPPHATLHKETNAAITNIDGRLDTLESGAADALVNIEQARLVADTWTISGNLTSGNVNVLLLPIRTNLTQRQVRFESAVISVLTAPAGGPIEVDIVTGALSTLNSPTYPAAGQTSILTAGKMSIAAGAFSSAVVRGAPSNGFKTTHDVDRYVAAVVTKIGTTTPGGYLTIQLNRLL